MFEFVSYNFKLNKKEIIFRYKMNCRNRKPLFFIEKIILPEIPNLDNIPKKLLDNILQGIHLMLGVSYYKLYCSSKVKINSFLSQEQAEFWNIVYKKGLGEFFYQNKLDPKRSPKFPFQKKGKTELSQLLKNNKMLVGIGGGKDSIVAVELLKEQNQNITAFIVETGKESKIVSDVIRIMGVKSLKIKRILDQKIFEKHEGSYNGHIPISLIFAFLGILAAVLYKYSYITVGNEQSSNFGNLKFKGEDINHQWSKSSEAENLFQSYVEKFISPDLKYFSPLRPFYEIRVVEMFSRYKKYFPYFSSCNMNFKVYKERSNKTWCGQCPKCAFMFILLAAFLSKKQVISIFNKNLFQDKELLPIFKDLLGFGKAKPFDCVGTFKETQTALYLTKDKFKNDLVVKTFLSKVKFNKNVFKTQQAANMPVRFKFLGMKNALILGYGKEGKITHKYLKNNFPKLKISIADKSLDKNYLKKQDNFDIAIKTPGIPKELVKIPYTTATNIFFEDINNKIIGVTGSKGKSTTTSLIHQILKTSGRKSRLLGNIGNPMLEVMSSKIYKNEIFVLELSSYQLDDIQFSPSIAVILNLFPDHLDYHQKLDNYYQAKKNIINFQNKNDFFVYNQKDKKLVDWAKSAKAQIKPFIQEINFKQLKTNLFGEHNLENIRAAITVAKLLDISDKIIKKAIKEFKPLEHRLEFVGEFNHIKFYNDAASTTPNSTIKAIKSLKKIGTIFLGGKDRGYDFLNLDKTIREKNIKNIVLFPDSGKKMLKSKKGLKILETSVMEKAVEFAYKNTSKGEICLLSTASPSYSLWKNFEEKGDQFKKYVQEY